MVATAREPATASVSRYRMREPVIATLSGRRSNASGSCAEATASADCASAMKGSFFPDTLAQLEEPWEVGTGASNRPVQINDATSATDRERANSTASCPR